MTDTSDTAARVQLQLDIAAKQSVSDIDQQITQILRHGEPDPASYRGQLLAGYRQIRTQKLRDELDRNVFDI
ncbi:MAG TPA: hypothetical protein VKP88_05210 [Candidatus Paceibacterota bacterium]|nr:hypothetical protein [Candidatus Paceibacterota bacterium]